MAVGLKQKDIVNNIVEKVIIPSRVQFFFDLKLILSSDSYCWWQFLSSDFVVMLFHYDGFVDGWKSLAWSNHVIHLSAINQTKWYKRLRQIFSSRCNNLF